jgi:hypothetical protein
MNGPIFLFLALFCIQAGAQEEIPSSETPKNEPADSPASSAAASRSRGRCNIHMGMLEDPQKGGVHKFNISQVQEWRTRLLEKGYNLLADDDLAIREPGTFRVGNPTGFYSDSASMFNKYRCDSSSLGGFSIACELSFTLSVNKLPINLFPASNLRGLLRVDRPLFATSRTMPISTRYLAVSGNFFSRPSPQSIRLKQIEMLPTCAEAIEKEDRNETVVEHYSEILELAALCQRVDPKVIDQTTFDYYNVTLRQSISEWKKYPESRGREVGNELILVDDVEQAAYREAIKNETDLNFLLRNCPLLSDRNRAINGVDNSSRTNMIKQNPGNDFSGGRDSTPSHSSPQ